MSFIVSICKRYAHNNATRAEETCCFRVVEYTGVLPKVSETQAGTVQRLNLGVVTITNITGNEACTPVANRCVGICGCSKWNVNVRGTTQDSLRQSTAYLQIAFPFRVKMHLG